MVRHARLVVGGVESVVAVGAAHAEVLAEGVGHPVEGGRHGADVGKAAAVVVGSRAVQRVLRHPTIAWAKKEDET